ncbi:MAG TPA: hypothetical protein VFV51_11955, partial [Vicinamibacterales bacterium]|nr:hypothetical protein [Vicinamibacterales bacterium]
MNCRLPRDGDFCFEKIMRIPAPRLFATVCGLWLAAVLSAQTGPTYGPGTVIESLTVGPTTYRQVKVRSVNARTLVILHAGGMASLRLRDLPPEWRERFKYDPAAEAALEQTEAATRAAQAAAPKPKPKAAAPTAKKRETPFEALLRSLGQPVVLKAEVDLRSSMASLNLSVKDQGRRPSCAIFSIVSALEYQNALLAGRAEKFSEEYLIWAVRRTTKRLAPPGVADTEADQAADEGFSLGEVVTALRAYGIPLQATMPNTFGTKIEAIEDPPEAIVEEARQNQRIGFHALPGRDNATRINNLVIALNSGVPVPVGMAWPHWRTAKSGFLNAQKPPPNAWHAVTLVGYRCP